MNKQTSDTWITMARDCPYLSQMVKNLYKHSCHQGTLPELRLQHRQVSHGGNVVQGDHVPMM
jgi:hypothetical protein